MLLGTDVSGYFTRISELLFRDARLLKSVAWNAAGTGLPLFAAVFAVPPLIQTLGTERFGVLSLAWVVVGYFSFFDLGLGRAMTQLIAQRLGMKREADIPAITQTGMLLMCFMGVVGGLLVASVSPWLASTQLSIPAGLVEETLVSFLILAASIPIVIVSTGLRGVLEGWQRFDVVNIVRAPLGAVTYLGPLLATQFSDRLPLVVALLLTGRLLSLIAYAWFCCRLFPQLIQRWEFDLHTLRPLLSFGGWMTLSNLAGPVLLYAGRLALAIMVSAEAVAYFSTPYDVVISILLIPNIFLGVFFPIFTQKFRSDLDGARFLYRRSLLQNLIVVFPICLFTFLFAKPALALWISPEFAENSYVVAQVLAVGVFINSFGYYSQALIQAYGRPDLTGKLHVAELIAYVPYMIWLVDAYGVEGAAVAWIIRVSISTVALAVIARACLTNYIAANRTNIETIG